MRGDVHREEGVLGDRALEAVVERLIERTYRPNQVIFSQGDEGKEFFVLAKGNATASIQDATVSMGKRIFMLRPGSYFGEKAILDNHPRAATVKAKNDAIVWVIDRQNFKNILMKVSADKRWPWSQP